MNEDSIDACLGRIRAAWGAGDAHAYGQEFTEDAAYVIFLGDPLSGRDELERNHVPVFARWQKGTRMRVEPIVTRRLGEDVSVGLTVGGIGKGDGSPFDKLQTYTFVLQEGRWRCSAFQNTRMSRGSKRTYNARSGAFLARLFSKLFYRSAMPADPAKGSSHDAR
ncbi:SgcJ/EcaC family oxidoreductase [Comamonas sp. JC664]|uniref:SgcJ/EcaC family oxidoreductase n=1 Tax=Comamonas sp. JC664 TaxID=2801917 RepID=UPI00174C5285|nr:SgcJ/EcaC family oxidoreductase [Comamonas sp. JC664]MBL0693905.1 SgcJ/EcaC family oxidoreductase [Comamonas sp. JC664]GHH04580.1 hypothetical protein GCM10012319_74140 [Comamonas sp. KCTC 72670]